MPGFLFLLVVEIFYSESDDVSYGIYNRLSQSVRLY